MKKKKNKKIVQGTCVWINEVGSIKTRVFKIVGVRDKNIKIDFGKGETYLIKKDHVRLKRIVIFKTSDGKN